MKKEQIATIGYGNLDLNFLVSESVENFMRENEISSEMMFPKTQYFYQGVLMKLGISHKDEKELDVVYNGVRLDGEGVCDVLDNEYEKFENFPIHIDDKIYLVDFGVKVSQILSVGGEKLNA